MARFIIVTFALLGWAFYEMSGGADFEPRSARLAQMQAEQAAAPQPATAQTATQTTAPAVPLDTNVTRVSLNLTTVEDVLTGGTTQPARAVAPLPDSGAGSAPSDVSQTDPQKILPSLVDSANETAVLRLSTTGLRSAEPTAPDATLAAAPAANIRRVSGSRVNVRGGPGTGFEVVSGLVQGDAIEVLEDDGIGWVRMRPVDGGPEGWIATFLLEDG